MPKMDDRRRGKLHPKLRMIANADSSVNALRAELASALSVPSLDASTPLFREAGATPIAPDAATAIKAPPTQWKPDKKTMVNVFVDLRHAEAPPVTGEICRKGNIAVAQVPVAEVGDIAARLDVAMVSPGESLKFAPPQQAVDVPAPKPRETLISKDVQVGSVLLGIIDVQGFDFAHEDFLTKDDDGNLKTRFVRIWDQAGRTRKPPTYTNRNGKPRFDGAEIRAEHMNKAIAQTANGGIPAVTFEPQSQMVPGSHGTHVASIAGGNTGFCPNALIAAVLVSLPQADLDRRKSFYDSSRLIDAIDYLLEVADELGHGTPLPISINISLGTNGDAHDGSSPVCRWIDSLLATSGRCLSVAGGNAGQAAPMAPGDIGYVMGRIHTASRIPSRGLQTTLDWTVVGNGRADISENELELWYSAQDRFRVWLMPPDSDEWIGPVGEREYIENRQLANGTFVSIYNEVYHPVNGCNQIAIYLSPNLDADNMVGVAAGVWVVRLEGVEVRDGRFHGWIERDDPAPLGKLGPQEAWRFPSYFSEKTNVPVSQISSLACSPRIVSVANLDSRRSRIHETSSQGPTRDGRFKPDVAAPGTAVVAAKGFGGDDRWIAMTGTSMASPCVAGVAAAMLSIAPRLNAAQIGGIMQRTAKPLPGKTFDWATDAGFGVIDPQACIAEAQLVNARKDITEGGAP